MLVAALWQVWSCGAISRDGSSWWWHSAAGAGSDWQHSSAALGPATNIKTIERTDARSTNTRRGQRQEPGHVARGAETRIIRSFRVSRWSGCGISPIGAENPAPLAV